MVWRLHRCQGWWTLTHLSLWRTFSPVWTHCALSRWWNASRQLVPASRARHLVGRVKWASCTTQLCQLSLLLLLVLLLLLKLLQGCWIELSIWLHSLHVMTLQAHGVGWTMGCLWMLELLLLLQSQA